MNQTQEKIFTTFKNTNDNIAILGSGGTGKSYVFNKMIDDCQASNLYYLVTAMTGVSAELIGGRTLHSALGIGLVDESTSVVSLMKRLKTNRMAKVWNELEILFVDEISMMTPLLFRLLNMVAQEIRSSEELFGGIRLIVCGDFLQLGPVSKKLKEELLLFECEEWKVAFPIDKIFHLTELVRQKNDIGWGELLNRLRYGILTNEDKMKLYERKNAPGVWSNDIKIFCHNNSVDALNLKKLQEAIESGAASKVFYSKCIDKELKREDVKLCIGARVMHTINNAGLDIWNGSLGTVVSFTDDGAVILFDNGNNHLILPYTAKIKISKNNSIETTYLPLRLAWAITVHRVQGATLEKGVVNLSGMFLPGQAYTALSRFKSISNVLIEALNPNMIQTNRKCVEYCNSIL